MFERGSNSSITFNYHGELAHKMALNYDALRRFAGVADFRTNVSIREVRGLRIKPTYDFERHEATIWLPDQQLIDETEAANQGVFDQDLFFRKVNQSVRKGMSMVLAAEKEALAMCSPFLNPFNLIIEGLYGGVTCVSANIAADGLHELPSLGGTAKLAAGGIMALNMFFGGVIATFEMFEEHRLRHPSLHIGAGDINPFKSTVDYTAGYSYLNGLRPNLILAKSINNQ